MNDLRSLLPQTNPAPALLPKIGEAAPEKVTFSTLYAFVRHCGCPFAEAEVKQLMSLSDKYKTLCIKVVCMSNEQVGKEWFARVGGKTNSRVELVCDEKRERYARWGVGIMGYGGLFSMPMMTSLLTLKKAGIVNTATGAGSNRWQNSGGFAVNSKGIVTFVKIAEHAGDMVDYEVAVKSLGL